MLPASLRIEGVVRQRSNKGRNAFGTVTADIHSAYDNDNLGTIMPYSQLPPGNSVSSGLIEDRTADIDRSLVPSLKRPSFELNPLTNKFVLVNAELKKPRKKFIMPTGQREKVVCNEIESCQRNLLTFIWRSRFL